VSVPRARSRLTLCRINMGIPAITAFPYRAQREWNSGRGFVVTGFNERLDNFTLVDEQKSGFSVNLELRTNE